MPGQDFPWEDIAASRGDLELQKKHRREEARRRYPLDKLRCPSCGARGADLDFFYFQSSAWSWQHLCGRAGWMAACGKCRKQVEFFLEMMN